MKKVIFTLAVCTVTLGAIAQNPLKKLGDIANSVKSNKGAGLSTEEIANGLKEALKVGAENSTGKLASVDGFLKDAAVKILMPEEVVAVEKKMRALGMGKLIDNAITSMNRAAEDASKQAAPIFLNAIKSMSITDALGILKGSDLAATEYLKKSTTNQLTEAFKPVIAASLEKVEATKYWKDVFTAYNKFSSKPVNTDLTEYVTGKSLDGIFYYVGLEEQKIRKDPAARVNEVLKKVFE